MCAMAAKLLEYVLPHESGLRQWVLTFPFGWRATPARDGTLLGSLTRIFEGTVRSFYSHRARQEGHRGAGTGSAAVLQRTCADCASTLTSTPSCSTALGTRRMPISPSVASGT